jgi:alpha-D-ribose 1-methylphosphonate 5-triphosphate synthase subunit PhnG
MQSERQCWMGLIARAKWAELAPLLDELEVPAPVEWLRPPETGMVMLKARAGDGGKAFHMGEATVTRCVVRIGSGETGFSYLLGRNSDHARFAALLDALLQSDRREFVQEKVLSPLSGLIAERERMQSRKAAATKVDFFTLVRGEG